MTKDERLEQFEQHLRDEERYTDSQIGSAVAAFSRGYDEGFADGIRARAALSGADNRHGDRGDV